MTFIAEIFFPHGREKNEGNSKIHEKTSHMYVFKYHITLFFYSVTYQITALTVIHFAPRTW